MTCQFHSTFSISRNEKVKGPCRLSWILIGVLVLIVNAPANAYFSSFVEKKPISVVVPRSILQSGKASHVLLLSSNDEIQHRFSSSEHPLQSELPYFSYIDQLPVPEFLVRSGYLFLDHAFSIDNLLYANLKLARLLDEYEALRSRSEAVLEGLDVPFIQQHPDYEMTTQGKELNITEAVDRLLSHSHVVENSNYALQQIHGREGFDTASSTRRAIGQWNHTRRQFGINRGHANAIRNHSQAGEVFSGAANGEDTEDEAGKRRMHYGADGASEFPWLVRIPMAVLNYIYRNKIESAIYFLMLYGIVHVLFMAKR